MTASTAVIARNGDLALAGPLGSLDAYLDRVGRIPVLTRECSLPFFTGRPCRRLELNRA